MTRRTSIEAYRHVVENGRVGERQAQVYRILYYLGPLTANQTWEKLSQEIGGLRFDSNTRARFTELRELGLIREVGNVSDPITKRRVILWDVTDQMPVKAEKKELGRVRCVNEHADAARLIAWIQDAERKPAVTAFTEGPDRQVAYAVEWILTQLKDAREEIRRLKNGELF